MKTTNHLTGANVTATKAVPESLFEGLESVPGDPLPPIGDRVLIHLSRSDAWVEQTVVGYYVWGDLDGDCRRQRVFVRVVDAQGYQNARMLCDVRTLEGAPIVKSLTVNACPNRGTDCSLCVPLSTDGKSVFIEGVGAVALNFDDATDNDKAIEGLKDDISSALREAFRFGMTYWQQADSQYTSLNNKAQSTLALFEEFVSHITDRLVAKK